MIASFRAGLTLALVAVVGCGDSAPGPLRLDMSLDKTSVVRGDSVQVSLTLTNASPRTVMVYPSDAYGICFRAFEVFDTSGRQVATYEGLCMMLLSIAAPQPVELRRGEQLSIRDWWRPDLSTLEGEALPSGTYHVRGRAAADNTLLRSDPRLVMLQD